MTSFCWVVESLGHKGKIFLAEFLLHDLEVVPHEILPINHSEVSMSQPIRSNSPCERVGGGKLVESDGWMEVGEVHGMALVSHNNHVPGGSRVLAKLC